MTSHTIAEVATILHVSDDSIRRRLAEFGAVRIGRAYRITDAGIARFLEAHRVQPPKVREIRKRREVVSGPERLRAAQELRERARSL